MLIASNNSLTRFTDTMDTKSDCIAIPELINCDDIEPQEIINDVQYYEDEKKTMPLINNRMNPLFNNRMNPLLNISNLSTRLQNVVCGSNPIMSDRELYDFHDRIMSRNSDMGDVPNEHDERT